MLLLIMGGCRLNMALEVKQGLKSPTYCFNMYKNVQVMISMYLVEN